MGINVLAGPVTVGKGVMALNQKKVDLDQMYEKMFHNEDDETWEHIAQRGGLCPIPRNIQGQAGQGSEQLTGLMTSLLVPWGLEQLNFNGPFHPKLVYDSTICCFPYLLFSLIFFVLLRKKLSYLCIVIY